MEQVRGRRCGPSPASALHGCARAVGVRPQGRVSGEGGVGSASAVSWLPTLTCVFVLSPPSPCSRVGFYVNTFQSIAGLEENFHREMSKVGGACPPGPGRGQGPGAPLACPAEVLHRPLWP